jgi:AraC-like DNA-binding protein
MPRRRAGRGRRHINALDRETFIEATRADFVLPSLEPLHTAALRSELLDATRLPCLADAWFDACGPVTGDLARRLFTAVHDPSLKRLSIPDIAKALGTSPRTLRRRLGRLRPRDLRTLGRLVGVAIDIARDPATNITWHAGTHGFADYGTCYRAFVRFFGDSPKEARRLMGPAALWSAWRERTQA